MANNPLLLSSENIFQYLAQRNLIDLAAQSDWRIEPQYGKNFNLSIRSSARGMLLKQERLNPDRIMLGELLNESVVCQLLQQLPLGSAEVNIFNPQVIDFDRANSAIIFEFLADYQDLSWLYHGERDRWSLEIPRSIGKTIATIHQLTFDRQDYHDFLLEHLDGRLARSLVKIGRLSPEIFGAIPSDGIKFYTLYQRYASLDAAIDKLIATTQARCLIHNDFKLNNILLHQDWEERGTDLAIVRPIDWERGTWGDPAIDLGNFIASYLQIWLSNLVVNKTMRIEESLELAVIPLDALRPSISALVNGYLAQFPEILEFDPHFLSKVVQCAGFSLIQQIEAVIQYEKNLSNRGICTLQVAKSLLCNPDESMSVIFDRQILT
jgi:Phosphotransferase enzyme family